MGMRRICVFGAGAIRGHLAARFAAPGHDVPAVARGANLEGIRSRGVALREGAHTIAGPVRASDRAAPCAFARAAGIDAPALEQLAALTARFAARKGLYSAP